MKRNLKRIKFFVSYIIAYLNVSTCKILEKFNEEISCIRSDLKIQIIQLFKKIYVKMSD